MEGILKDAKFGDKFVTKNGRVCIYWGASLDNSLPHAFEWKHKAIFDDGLCLYNINGGTCHPDDGFEIVSRY